MDPITASLIAAFAQPLVAGIANALFGPKPPPMPEKPPTLSAAEAEERAKATLQPIYQEATQRLMEELDKQAIARGVFGQVPSEALRQYRGKEMALKEAAAISQLKEQLIGQSEEAARQQQQLAMQYAMNNWNTQLANQIARTNALMAGVQSGLQGLQTIENLFPDWWAKIFGQNTKDVIRQMPSVFSSGQTQGTLGQLAPASEGPAGGLQYEYGFTNPYGGY